MNDTAKHLEMIQGIINRMAQVSFVIKGWTITLVAGLLAFAVNSQCWSYSLLALLPALVFWGLDAYYLRQERLFRRLYDKVRLGPTDSGIPPYSMDTKPRSSDVESWLGTLPASTLYPVHAILAVLAIAVTVGLGLS